MTNASPRIFGPACGGLACSSIGCAVPGSAISGAAARFWVCLIRRRTHYANMTAAGWQQLIHFTYMTGL